MKQVQITCIEVEVLLPAMAAGALDGDDAQNVYGHLAICPPCLKHLRDFQETVEQLAFVVPQIAPPSDLRGRVLQSVKAGPPVASAPLPLPLPLMAAAGSRPAARPEHPVLTIYRNAAPAVLAACLVLLVGAGFWMGTMREQLQMQDRQFAVATAVNNMLHDPQSSFATLKPIKADTLAAGQAIMAPQRREVGLMVTHLPQLPAGRVYQVWLLQRDAAPLAAGQFTVDDNGAVMTTMPAPNADTMDGLRVTDEPAGSPSPTSTGPTWLEVWYK
jgi:hypothetical protein